MVIFVNPVSCTKRFQIFTVTINSCVVAKKLSRNPSQRLGTPLTWQKKMFLYHRYVRMYSCKVYQSLLYIEIDSPDARHLLNTTFLNTPLHQDLHDEADDTHTLIPAHSGLISDDDHTHIHLIYRRLQHTRTPVERYDEILPCVVIGLRFDKPPINTSCYWYLL